MRAEHYPQDSSGRRRSDLYKIPTYKLHGSAVIYFAGWKKHYSLHVVAALKDDLVPYEVRKGTIRFPRSQPVPAKLIERITRPRAKEVAEAEKGRRSRRRSTRASSPRIEPSSCLCNDED